MKRLFPDAPTGYIRGEALTKDFVDTAKSLGCCRVAPLMKDKKGRVTDKEIVDYAHDNGMKVTGPPGSRVPGILQARTENLEWVAISFSKA